MSDFSTADMTLTSKEFRNVAIGLSALEHIQGEQNFSIGGFTEEEIQEMRKDGVSEIDEDGEIACFDIGEPKEPGFEIETDAGGAFYSREEILCANGDVEFRKAMSRVIVNVTSIGKIYVPQLRDLSASGASWITLPGIFPTAEEAFEAIGEFRKNYGDKI